MQQTIRCGDFGSATLDLPLAVETRFLGSGPAERIVIGLHGFGDRADNFIDLANACAYKKNVLWACLQAPEPSPAGPGGGQWTPLLGSHLESAQRAIQAVQHSAQMLCNAFNIPPQRCALLGFSQGAWLALSILLRSTQRWGAVVALSGFLNQVHKISEVHGQALSIPVFVAHGTQDMVVWPYQYFEVLDILKHFGFARVTSRLYAMDHTISQEELQHIAQFLGEHLV